MVGPWAQEESFQKKAFCIRGGQRAVFQTLQSQRESRSYSKALRENGLWGNGHRVVYETFSAAMTRTWYWVHSGGRR